MGRVIARVSVALVVVGLALTILPARGQSGPNGPVSDIAALTTGPDGNLWFAGGAANDIGRITLTGKLTVFHLPFLANPRSIISGPGGALYFTEFQGKELGRITTQGKISQVALSVRAGTDAIARGPDGTLWFTVGRDIGQFGPKGRFILHRIPIFDNFGIQHLAVTADGNIWFTCLFPQSLPKGGDFYAIERMTPAGKLTQFRLPKGTSAAFAITVGADGNLWYVRVFAQRVGRLTRTGVVTEYQLSARSADPQGITVGPDRSVWVTRTGATIFASTGTTTVPGGVDRVTRRGKVSEHLLPTATTVPGPIIQGADGNLWFVESHTATGPMLDRLIPGGGITRFQL